MMRHPRYLDQWRNDALERANKPWQQEMACIVQSVADRGGQVRASTLSRQFSPTTVEKMVRRGLLRRYWDNGAVQVAAQLNRSEWR
jgi:hypothetical protein